MADDIETAVEQPVIDEVVEVYIRNGRAKMAAALEAQPFRGAPNFDDLLAVCEAMLRHLVTAHPRDAIEESGAGPSTGAATIAEDAA